MQSDFISKNAMFPLLTLEVIIYVKMHCHLAWVWYSTGELDTIVNKFLFLQRIWGILYMVGCFVDFFIRIYSEPSFTFISSANYCSFWMVYYKSMFYLIMTSQLAVALNRFICVASPIEYHKRQLNNAKTGSELRTSSKVSKRCSKVVTVLSDFCTDQFVNVYYCAT